MDAKIENMFGFASSYIHYDASRSYGVIHRHIKSSIVLLDENWEPKVSGFGLSVKVLATRRDRLLVDDIVGTFGYLDPVYMETGSVTHRSDVYAFGVVMFEVLCGRKAIVIDGNYTRQQPQLVSIVRRAYEEGEMDEIINPNLRNQMNSSESFAIFSDTAYHCLKAQRPDMDKVAKRLEKALELHWKHQNPVSKSSGGVKYFKTEDPNQDQNSIFIFSPRKVSSTPMYVNLIYKMGNQSLRSYFTTWRDDGWMMIELWRFLNHKEQADFKVLLESFSQYYCKSEGIYVQGIEFRAIHNVTNKEINKLKEVQQVPQSNLKRDKIRFWTSKIKIKKDHLISKLNLKKDHLISEVNRITDHLHSVKDVFHSSSARSSRLQEEIELLSQQVVRIKCKIDGQLLTPNTECACYLVFKLSNECSGLHGPVIVRDLLCWKSKEIGIIYFRSPHPWNLHNATQVSRQREDGWMEVIVWKNNSTYDLRSGYIPINLKLIVYEGTMSGLVVRGLEFRPM